MTALPRFSQTPCAMRRRRRCTGGGSRSATPRPARRRRRAGACGRCRCRGRRESCRGCRPDRRPAPGCESACGQFMLVRGAGPAPQPRPRSFSAPARAATAKASAVSRAMPNLPRGRLAATSSLVLPARASSKSWIAAEPFMATALMTPLLNPVDQVRSAAGLDDVAAQRRDDGSAVVVGAAEVVADAPQRLAASWRGRRVEPVGDRGLGRRPAGRDPRTKTFEGRDSQIVGLQPVQIERFHTASLLSGSDLPRTEGRIANARPERPGRPRCEAECADTTAAAPPGGIDAASPDPSASSQSGVPAGNRWPSDATPRRPPAVGVMVGIGPESRQAGTEVQQGAAKRLRIAEAAEGRGRPPRGECPAARVSPSLLLSSTGRCVVSTIGTCGAIRPMVWRSRSRCSAGV